MRIVLFHTTLPQVGVKPGGVELVVHRLAEALAADERDTVTCVSLTPPPEGAGYAHHQVFPRVPWLRDSTLGRLAALPLLLNAVRWPEADVVHLHGDDWFLLRRPWATVRSFHGSALREAQSATSARRRALIVLLPLERLARRLATLSCATDDDTCSVLRTDAVEPFGVDTERFVPGPKDDHPTILFVGTWHGRKRGHLVHEAFLSHVLPRLPDARLWMVSDLPPPAHPQVRHFAAPDEAALADLYRRAWVFAYPSSYEGFGLTYLEAMASGTTVIATPNTATDRFLADGCGRVVEDAELGRAMVELLTDPEARSQIEARATVEVARYSWRAVARRHRERYAEAIGARRSGSGAAGVPPVES